MGLQRNAALLVEEQISQLSSDQSKKWGRVRYQLVEIGAFDPVNSGGAHTGTADRAGHIQQMRRGRAICDNLQLDATAMRLQSSVASSIFRDASSVRLRLGRTPIRA